MAGPPVPAPANPAQDENADPTPADPDTPPPNQPSPANPVGPPHLLQINVFHISLFQTNLL